MTEGENRKNAYGWGLLIILIAQYNLWPLLQHYHFIVYRHFFYVAGISAWVVVFYYLKKLHNGAFIWSVLFDLSIAKLIDELFFDPIHFTWDDYVSAGIVVLHQVYIFCKRNDFFLTTRTIT